MAQALKTAGYDFNFRFGVAGHDGAQLGLDLPESLIWLWRGYDAAGDYQTFEQDAVERQRPPYRVTVVNRDSWVRSAPRFADSVAFGGVLFVV